MKATIKSFFTIWVAVSVFVLICIPLQAVADPMIPGFTVTPFASVSFPRGVTFDSSTGNLFTINRDAGTLFKIAPNGEISLITDLPDLCESYIGPHFDPASQNLFVSVWDCNQGRDVLKITQTGDLSLFATGIPGPQV